ncbi:TetR/AcrR family transcriptional regulator [Fredinandcohnia humi]
MPKVTFFNLPENKKQTLLHAAKNEFSRVPLFDASISNIIKSAGIPRGSFYQYFEDKEDAFFYLLGEFAKEKKCRFLEILLKHDGDLFDSYIEFFDLIISEEENLQFLQNALLNMTHKIERTFEKMVSENEINEDFTKISILINKNKLSIESDKELFHAVQIITTVMFRNLIHTFAQEVSYQEAMENYRLEISLLQKGLSSNKI